MAEKTVNLNVANLNITGVRLVRLSQSGDCVVSLEIDGRWVDVIRDNAETISHIVEPSGIAILNECDMQSIIN